MREGLEAPITRGHRKREKTRGQLIEAGLRVLAEKGAGLTASEVAAEADVSNGTFYNYFPDREALIDALTEHLALSLAAAAAKEPVDDPAHRFALATGRVLRRASDDPTWARVVLRLADRPRNRGGVDLARYLREDLAEGHARGRFASGPDAATVDLVTGLILMTMRRIVDGRAGPDTIERAVERGLRALGVEDAAEVAAARS